MVDRSGSYSRVQQFMVENGRRRPRLSNTLYLSNKMHPISE